MPKRFFQNDGSNTASDQGFTNLSQQIPKRRKLPFGRVCVAPTSSTGSHQKNSSMSKNDDLSIRKLDPTNPEESQRIKTRYKMVQKGKNTVGYDEYIQKVPKESRRKIGDHPVTPDHRLDIPNRRWQGQVKAWRISLHQYDPKDLSSDIQMKPSVPKDTKPANTLAGGKQQNDIHTTIQETQIAQASSEGLQVDFSAISIEPCDIDDAKFVDCTNQSSKEMDEWENGDNELVDFDDSDDDLL